MNSFNLTIDGSPVTVSAGQSVLDAARKLGLDIPTLCYLEKCGPLNSCLVCLVKINGKLVPSCGTKAEPGMVVESETIEVHEARRTALELLFSEHVGDCLAPCHRLCPLQLNIPAMLRQIRAGQFAEASVTIREALPLAAILGRLCHHPCEQGCRRGSWDDPAAIRDLERFVTDWEAKKSEVRSPKSESGGGTPPEPADEDACATPTRKPSSGKSVVIIGAGPSGLAAAWQLLRQGHACTIADRHEAAGGTLRYALNEGKLPLEAELKHLERLGLQFTPGAELGRDLSLEGLSRGFDAVLIAVGEISRAEGEALGLEMGPGGIKVRPDTFQTRLPAVFAAGSAVRPCAQLVRAMSEGQAAAHCIHRFLSGQSVQRPGKRFSSIMGRLDKPELETFLRRSDLAGAVTPCDLCAGFNRREAGMEASRCLHCDCRASGNCALQFYAQQYNADANRFRQERPKFEQFVQPGGVIFEPGKCIKCGICVKLTELAREPLGLAFIGRGFEVRLSAPFNHTIAEGLQKVARECVDGCPTGALAFSDKLPV